MGGIGSRKCFFSPVYSNLTKFARILVNPSAKPCLSTILSLGVIRPHNSLAKLRSPRGRPGKHILD